MSINVNVTNGPVNGVGNGINVPASARISDIDTKPKTPEAPERPDAPDVAVEMVSVQGDKLSVTNEGLRSSQVGGTVQTEGMDGIVARLDEVKAADAKISEGLKNVLKDSQERGSKAIENAVENLKNLDDRVNERQEYMIEANASFTLSDPAYLSEEATAINQPK